MVPATSRLTWRFRCPRLQPAPECGPRGLDRPGAVNTDGGYLHPVSGAQSEMKGSETVMSRACPAGG